MSKLRDMIEANKRKAEQNAQIAPVLQSQAKQAVAVAETAGGPTANNAGSINQNSERAPSENNSVLGEKGPGEVGPTEPPKGLNALQLIKWKKEHGNSITKAATVPNNGANANVQNAVSAVSNANKEVPKGNSSVANGSASVAKSASGIADSQKTNSGSADLDALRANLAFLAQNIEQKELVAQVVRTIAVQLQQKPELVGQMSNADVDLIVRGLRRAYSIAARKKAEVKEAKQKKGVDTSNLHDAFKDAGLGDAFAGLKL